MLKSTVILYSSIALLVPLRLFLDQGPSAAQVSCLRDLPRPDTKNRGIVRGKATLWEVDHSEQFIQQAEGVLEQIVADACVQPAPATHAILTVL